jgi:hypothetical protein
MEDRSVRDLGESPAHHISIVRRQAEVPLAERDEMGMWASARWISQSGDHALDRAVHHGRTDEIYEGLCVH